MKYAVELEPFVIPDFARLVITPGLSFVESPTIPLSDLSWNTLDEMCDDFRKAVFTKAGLAHTI